jgi:uncharacterized membrane protein
MFTGLFINTTYPLIGFPKPLSLYPLLITLNVFILILCIAAYYINKDISIHIPINNIRQIFSPSALFLILLPFLSILGAGLINISGNNSLLLLLMVVISSIILVAAISKRFIPSNLYPLAIVTIAIALLFHSILISYYIRGGDIQYEYSRFLVVMSEAYWDPTISHNLNAMLSIVMLSPIYSSLLDMSGIWIFKIIYPLIYSLVPLALYQAYKEQIGELPAFLSTFFFMSFVVFFLIMPTLARQEIAELFFALLIMLMVDRQIDKTNSAILCIIFSASLIVSHYGLSYIYMICLIFALLLFWFWFMRTSTGNNIKQRSTKNVNKYLARVSVTDDTENTKRKKTPFSENKILTVNSVVLYVTIALAWYMYASSSSVFNTVVYIGNQIQNSIFTDFLSPATKDVGMSMALGLGSYPSFGYFISAIVFDVAQFFIIVGILEVVIRQKGTKLNREYAFFSFISLIVLLLAIVVPHFANSLEMIRVYHIFLFFLAPFCIVGVKAFFGVLSRLLTHSKHLTLNKDVGLPFVSMILVIFFLFQTGFIFEVTDDVPLSYALSYDNFAYEYVYKQDFIGAMWLSNHINDKITVYGDFGQMRFYDSFSNDNLRLKSFPVSDMGDINITERDASIYLRYGNILSNKLYTGKSFVVGREAIIPLDNLTFLDYKSKIYDNDAEVYL